MKGERIVGGISCGEVLTHLSDYLDGALDAATLEQIRGHVAGCDVCERFGRDFSTVIEAVRASDEPEPLDPGVAERLKERLRRE